MLSSATLLPSGALYHAAERLPTGGRGERVVNHVLPDPGGAAPAYDAIAEDWFDSPEALQAALASPEGQAVNADAPTLLDLARLQFFVVQEEAVALPAGQPPSTAG